MITDTNKKSRPVCIQEPCRRSWYFTEGYAIIVPLQYIEMFKYIIDTSAMIILIQNNSYLNCITTSTTVSTPMPIFLLCSSVLFSHKAKAESIQVYTTSSWEVRTTANWYPSQPTLSSINPIL